MTDSNIGGEASILEERRRKLEELRADNKAYINNFFPTKHALELHALHGHLSKEDLETAQIHNLALAGRIVLKRVMGNASFITIRDGSGDIQIYISKNNIDVDLYKNFKTWDLDLGCCRCTIQYYKIAPHDLYNLCRFRMNQPYSPLLHNLLF